MLTGSQIGLLEPKYNVQKMQAIERRQRGGEGRVEGGVRKVEGR